MGLASDLNIYFFQNWSANFEDNFRDNRHLLVKRVPQLKKQKDTQAQCCEQLAIS